MNQNNNRPSLRLNLPPRGHGDKRSRIFPIGMILILLGLIPFVLACEPAEATKERKNMAMKETNSEGYTAKPPMDASTPADAETATFALG